MPCLSRLLGPTSRLCAIALLAAATPAWALAQADDTLRQSKVAQPDIADSRVPGVGAVWESTLEYDVMPSDNGHSRIRRAKETATVVRLESGRPVFSGEVFGYRGEIIESSAGTVVYTDECKDQVPAGVLYAPARANQCVWHVCHAPRIGETFTRPMVFYVQLFSCEPKVATYTFKSLRIETLDGQTVTVGDARVYFSPFRQTAWQSYIREGHGEVFAEAPGRKTTYHRVQVPLVRYTPPALASGRRVDLATAPVDVLPDTCEFIAFGDSLTEGLGARREDAYPAQLAAFFGKPICNLGISGSTTRLALSRLPEVLALRPRVVFITLGANDALQGVDPIETARNLLAIVDRFRQAQVLVALLSLEGVASSLPPAVRAMLAACKEIESREGVVVLPDVFVGVLDDKANMSSDGIHPNANGYRQLARNILEQGFAMLKAIPAGPARTANQRQ